MVIPLSWRYLLAFFCLGTLLGIGHEFAHHFAGYLICGEWGYKTFNSFDLAAVPLLRIVPISGRCARHGRVALRAGP